MHISYLTFQSNWDMLIFIHVWFDLMKKWIVTQKQVLSSEIYELFPSNQFQYTVPYTLLRIQKTFHTQREWVLVRYNEKRSYQTWACQVEKCFKRGIRPSPIHPDWFVLHQVSAAPINRGYFKLYYCNAAQCV